MGSPFDPPRKVVVGTVCHAFTSAPPELDARIALSREVIAEARQEAGRLGRGLDLMVLPEICLTGGEGPAAADCALPLQGRVQDAFGEAARDLGAYIITCMIMAQAADGPYHNVAVLFDRAGEVAGIYRKIHPVASLGHTDFEGGVSVGEAVPVFECDFGRLGIQICFDMFFDDGWELLARKGAEIVAWPSATPQLTYPAFRARRGGHYIVSSTWKHNATVFDPAGLVAAQVTAPGRVAVAEVDLSWMVLPWSQPLREGEAFREAFGEGAGYRYSTVEDRGLFWSNDPALPVGEMARQIGVIGQDEQWGRNLRLHEAARGGPAG